MRKSTGRRRGRPRKDSILGRHKVDQARKTVDLDYPHHLFENVVDIDRLCALYDAMRQIIFAHQLTLPEIFPAADSVKKWRHTP